jgi:hypothetical protein
MARTTQEGFGDVIVMSRQLAEDVQEQEQASVGRIRRCLAVVHDHSIV